MSKLKFNYDEIKKIIPDLQNMVKDLKNMSTDISDISMPNFSKMVYLKDLKGDLVNTAAQIDDFIDILLQVNRMLDDLVDSYDMTAKNLPDYKLEVRNSVIKL